MEVLRRPGIAALAIAGAIGLVPALAIAGETKAWRVIGTASASGDFAVASGSGTARRPNQVAVRITNSRGGRVSGLGVVSCSRGFSIGSNSTQYGGRSPYLRVLRMPMKRADSCDVIASASSTTGGRLVIRILAR
jgi:hypothetical protein